MTVVPLLAVLVSMLPAPAAKQKVSRPFTPGRDRDANVAFQLVPDGWYSGDTHEHTQSCDNNIELMIDVILNRMEVEDLDIASVLVWNPDRVSPPPFEPWDPPQLPFIRNVCSVTGVPEDLALPNRIVQYGVETSGLTCSKWGHLIALNIGPDQAKIAWGSVAEDGACEDMDGFGLEGDGTGHLSSTIANHFYLAPKAVCGYAHTFWNEGLYDSGGYDWSELTTDAAYLDQEEKLAVPQVQPSSHLPLFAAHDVVLGNAQFVETVVGPTAVPFLSPVHWTQLYYKLQSAGARVTLVGGTDLPCTLGGKNKSDYLRTYVRAGEFSYDAWTSGLAAGRTTIASGGRVFLRLRVDGAEVGSDVYLDSLTSPCTATVELRTADPIDDCIELIVNGEVVASRPVVRYGMNEAVFTFHLPLLLPGNTFERSSWVAARLCSLKAHTGAVYVNVGNQPIADPEHAEYWMVWCDIIAKAVEADPNKFGGQTSEALLLNEKARRAFKTLRDVHGFDAAWNVTRRGKSTPACRGPIAIGTTGPAVNGQPLTLTCVNAPPLASGFLVLSRDPDPDPDGTCDTDILSFVDTDTGSLIKKYIDIPSTRSGYAEVEISGGDIDIADGTIYAQFVWTNPAGCTSESCSGGVGARSASDALELVVQL